MLSAIATPNLPTTLPPSALVPATPVDVAPAPGRLPPVAVAQPVSTQAPTDQSHGHTAIRISAPVAATVSAQATFTAAPLRSSVGSGQGPSSSFLAHLLGQGSQDDISVFSLPANDNTLPPSLDTAVNDIISRLKYKPSNAALPRLSPPSQPLSQTIELPVHTESAEAAPAPRAEPTRQPPESLLGKQSGATAYDAANQRAATHLAPAGPSFTESL